MLLRATYIYVDYLITNQISEMAVAYLHKCDYLYIGNVNLGCRDSPAIQIVLLFIQ